MSDTVIRVNNLGKLYQIGTARDKADGLRHAVEDGFRRFGQRLRGRPITKPVTEDFWALKDVSFEVKRGECVGVIGRNGAGKSTLLKILSRITEPTTGEVGLKGHVGSLLEVGTGFHPELTGRENVFLNGAVLGMSRKEISRKFDEIVAFSEVEKFLDTPVKRYSSGMYVRLAFAVAAHLEPEILIVDEVLAVGDAEYQKKCQAKIKSLARDEGRTVCFVSHDVNVLSKLCTYAYLLESGRLVYAGPVWDAIRQYAHNPTADAESSRQALSINSTGSRIGLIESVRLFTSAGVDSYSFRPSDEIIVRVQLAVDPPTVIGGRIGIGINNPLGQRSFACANYLSGVELGRFEGRVGVDIRFRLPDLVPGHYTLDVAAMDGSNQVLHAAYPVAALVVIDPKVRLNSTAIMPEYFGHVIVPADWEVSHN